MNSAPQYFLIVIDDSLDFVPPNNFSNFNRIRLSDYHLNINKNSGQFLSQPEIINHINQTAKNQPVAIIPFKPSAKIQHICQEQNWIYVANPAKINRFLEDKINFATLCSQHHIPNIPNRLGLYEPNFIALCQKEFGTPLIIQTRFGWAGQSTFSFDDQIADTPQIPPNTPIKVMPHLNGYTLLNNCCWYGRQLIQSPPALQLTGLKGLTVNQFTTVGRQWPSYAPVDVINKVTKITNDFGQIIKDIYNYRGFFGLDFFVGEKNDVYLLECNPRLTASYSYFSTLELQSSLVPIFYYHIDEFINYFNYPVSPNRYQNIDIMGTEITPKDNSGTTTKTIHLKKPVTTNPHEIILPII